MSPSRPLTLLTGPPDNDEVEVEELDADELAKEAARHKKFKQRWQAAAVAARPKKHQQPPPPQQRQRSSRAAIASSELERKRRLSGRRSFSEPHLLPSQAGAHDDAAGDEDDTDPFHAADVGATDTTTERPLEVEEAAADNEESTEPEEPPRRRHRTQTAMVFLGAALMAVLL
jgi:hypothetical protein